MEKGESTGVCGVSGKYLRSMPLIRPAGGVPGGVVLAGGGRAQLPREAGPGGALRPPLLHPLLGRNLGIPSPPLIQASTHCIHPLFPNI